MGGTSAVSRLRHPPLTQCGAGRKSSDFTNLGLLAVSKRRKGNWKTEAQNPGNPTQPTKQVLKENSGKGSKTAVKGYSDLHVISALGAGREALQAPAQRGARCQRLGRAAAAAAPVTGVPARPGGGIPAVQPRQSWNPTLCPAPTRDHRPQQSPRLRARTRNHRTENISPRPPVAIQHHDHSFPTVAPGEPAPSPASSGGRLRGLVRVAAGQFPPAPLPRCPGTPARPHGNLLLCRRCYSQTGPSSKSRPVTGPPPRAGEHSGVQREGRCTPQARSAPARGPEGLEPPGSRTPGHSRPPVGLQAERSPCGPAPGNRDPRSPADPGPSTR